jgi:hypothetical protein
MQLGLPIFGCAGGRVRCGGWLASGAGLSPARYYSADPGNTASILAFSVAALNGLTM